MKFLRQIFWNKWLIALFLAILMQQVLVALGTYFLGSFTNEFPILGFQTSLALAWAICIALPGTLLHYFIEIFLTLSSKSSQFYYLSQYSKDNYNHPTHYRSQNSKEQKHDIMIRSGQDTINKALFFFTDVTATGFNIVFNTISVALVTDLWFGLVILIAGLSGTLIIYLLKDNISKSSKDEMIEEARLNEHMSKSWDNIILGNKSFYDRWVNNFVEIFRSSKSTALTATRRKIEPISLAGLITNGIVLISALYIVWVNQHDVGIAMAVLVMLPRSLQVVMHIQIFQKYLAQWKSLQEKLSITEKSLKIEEPLNLVPFISCDKIKYNDKLLNIEQFSKHIKNIHSGRITITGDNGTGKSNLMLILKEKFGNGAVYLPAHHRLILQEPDLKLSSGEVTLSTLKDIKNENYEIILLDEWDANLSKENKQAISEMLTQLSLHKVVIEVRHHL